MSVWNLPVVRARASVSLGVSVVGVGGLHSEVVESRAGKTWGRRDNANVKASFGAVRVCIRCIIDIRPWQEMGGRGL